MTLTVTEKEHWKVRIGRKISQAIADLVEREEPGYLNRIGNEARKEAIKHLGLADLLAREESLEDQEKKVRRDKDEVHRQLAAAVRHVSSDEVRNNSYYHSSEWEQAIQKRQEAEERRLMATSPLGAVILKLKREEEELLDTVWLATSSKQIKDLWRGVAELVSAEPTRLQKQAMQVDDDPTET